MDQPTYLGVAVSELSKLHMFESFYDNYNNISEKKNTIVYTDTDRFVFIVKTKNFNKDMKNIDCLFDFINLNENHELFSNKNKKVIGKFKEETPETIWINEFVFLRSERYAFILWKSQ